MAVGSLFFYGTLRHLPLLEIILGRPRARMNLVPATLENHQIQWVKDQPFPMIKTAAGGSAQGLLLRDATDADVARLDFYEGGFAYDLQEVQVQTDSGEVIKAQVYFPRPGTLDPGDIWSLEDWVRDWAALSEIVAKEAIGRFGQWSAEELSRKLPMMRRRADTILAARARGPAADHHQGREDVEVLSQDRVHSHFFALDHMVLRHPKYDGSMTVRLDREVFFAGQAVVVLPYDPVRDEVIVIQQFRVNMYALGDPSPWIVEAVAGLIDPGETPEVAARREAEEEAGVHPTRLEMVSAAYSSTGSSTEFITSYVALADFSALSRGGGLDGECEDIRRLILPFKEFEDGLRTHRFRDAPLISTGFWLTANRDRLRSSA